MLKKTFIFLLLFVSVGAIAQSKYFSKNAYISFYSSTPIEDILGESNEALTFLDAENGEIVFAALMNSFHFERALMEEHFNENYVESSKFPKAKFKGAIMDFNPDMLKQEKSEITVSGELSLHGVTKKISAPGSIEQKDEKLTATAAFKVKPEDYAIEIPNLVRDKIGKEFEVTVKVNYAPYNR